MRKTAAILLILTSSGCSKAPVAPKAAGASVSDAGEGNHRTETTAGFLAVANLEAQIESLDRVRRDPSRRAFALSARRRAAWEA